MVFSPQKSLVPPKRRAQTLGCGVARHIISLDPLPDEPERWNQLLRLKPPPQRPRADMPRRTDLHKILLIGSGPIVIGQACEFDYSGTQACKALREEGYTVVLVNSNPATLMTDPETADRTYIEPITWEVLARIIERERPDALLPTLGGQTGLNTAIALHRHGVLDKFKVEMIGANPAAIEKAEDREKFKQAMVK